MTLQFSSFLIWLLNMMWVICWNGLFSFFCANKISLMIFEGMLFSDDISIVFNWLNLLQSHDTGIVKLSLIFQSSSKYVSQSLSTFQLSGLKDESSAVSKDSNSFFILIIHYLAKILIQVAKAATNKKKPSWIPSFCLNQFKPVKKLHKIESKIFFLNA